MKRHLLFYIAISLSPLEAGTLATNWLSIEHNTNNIGALGSSQAGSPELSLDLKSGNINAGSLNLGYNVLDPVSLNSIGTFLIESAGTGSEWRWQTSGIGGTNLKNQMALSMDGKLSVFGSEGRSVVIDSNTASVQIFGQNGLTHSLLAQDQAGNVAVSGSLTVAGKNVLTQPVNVSTNTLLLAGGATTAAGYTVAIGPGAATSGFMPTLALGQNSRAYNTGAIALGMTANANGGSCIAVGASAASAGTASVALGSMSRANGPAIVPVGGVNNGVAIGVGAGAEGLSAVAFGNGGPRARGFYSISIGRSTEANGANQTVIGRCNEVFPAVPEMDTTAFNDASVTFVLGNGYQTLGGPTVKQNAMTVRRDNGAAIGTGVSSGGAAQFVVGAYNAAPAAATPETGAAFVVGSGYQKDANGNRLPLAQYAATNQTVRQNALVVRWNGDVEASGALNATGVTTGPAGVSVPGAFKAGNGVVLVAQQGDIDMGEFRSGTQP